MDLILQNSLGVFFIHVTVLIELILKKNEKIKAIYTVYQYICP